MTTCTLERPLGYSARTFSTTRLKRTSASAVACLCHTSTITFLHVPNTKAPGSSSRTSAPFVRSTLGLDVRFGSEPGSMLGVQGFSGRSDDAIPYLRPSPTHCLRETESVEVGYRRFSEYR